MTEEFATAYSPEERPVHLRYKLLGLIEHFCYQPLRMISIVLSTSRVDIVPMGRAVFTSCLTAKSDFDAKEDFVFVSERRLKDD